MARKCAFCGKKPMFGNRISHANNATRRRFNPNIRKMRVVVNGVKKRVIICSDCLSAGKAVRT
ncbi:MAG: 50S ribosomal protein L28 [bacterium]